MGITTLLRFALLCFDLLAWPAIALGYPLFASIRAVESGSKHHMMKLVIYWTLFSLFSLFEFSFGKIIEWIPLWSRVRLVVILWLVVPQFDGACHAYQGLVRPILWVKVQAVTDRFYKLKEERFCERETFLDVDEKYINEKESGAVEELIALKKLSGAVLLILCILKQHESQKCIKSQRDDMKVVESEGKNAAVASKQVSYAQSTASLNQTDAVTDVKETTPPHEIADDRRPETPPITKTQPEWTCGLCKMTAMSEIALNAHLQGKKHKSKLESLKASMLCAKDKGPSPLVKEMMPSKETAEKRCHKTSPLKKARQEWTLKTNKLRANDAGLPASAKCKGNQDNLVGTESKDGEGSVNKSSKAETTFKHSCFVCGVKCLSDVDMASHLRGKRHSSNIEALIS